MWPTLCMEFVKHNRQTQINTNSEFTAFFRFRAFSVLVFILNSRPTSSTSTTTHVRDAMRCLHEWRKQENCWSHAVWACRTAESQDVELLELLFCLVFRSLERVHSKAQPSCCCCRRRKQSRVEKERTRWEKVCELRLASAQVGRPSAPSKAKQFKT